MKKTVLFVSLHRPGRSPSQRFRFEQYIEFLNNNGFDSNHLFLLNQSQDRIYYSQGKFGQKLIIVLSSVAKLIRNIWFRRYDMVFVQREAFMLGSSVFERWFSRKSKLMFDFDDAIWMSQTGAIRSKNAALMFLKNPKKTIKIIESADLVFAGNQFLHDHAIRWNTNVRIVPTTIDTKVYQVVPKVPKDKTCIGWSGSFSTIIHFELILPVLEKLKEKFGSGIFFKVIGDERFHYDKLGIHGLAWNKDSEVYDLSEIDIGLMPLPDDDWTRGKCGLKGLQYMALGIPTIMSPVGVNTKIIQDGVNGYLANDPEEWFYKLSLLVESFETRISIGLKGRETVEKYYSVDVNQQLYLNSFRELTS